SMRGRERQRRTDGHIADVPRKEAGGTSAERACCSRAERDCVRVPEDHDPTAEARRACALDAADVDIRVLASEIERAGSRERIRRRFARPRWKADRLRWRTR